MLTKIAHEYELMNKAAQEEEESMHPLRDAGYGALSGAIGGAPLGAVLSIGPKGEHSAREVMRRMGPAALRGSATGIGLGALTGAGTSLYQGIAGKDENKKNWENDILTGATLGVAAGVPYGLFRKLDPTSRLGSAADGLLRGYIVGAGTGFGAGLMKDRAEQRAMEQAEQ